MEGKGRVVSGVSGVGWGAYVQGWDVVCAVMNSRDRVQYSAVQFSAMQHRKMQHRKMQHSAAQHTSYLPLHHYLSHLLPPSPTQHLDIQASLNDLHRHIYLMFKRVATEMNEKTSKLQQAKLEAMMERTHSNYELGG
jgi:hypothetical protein